MCLVLRSTCAVLLTLALAGCGGSPQAPTDGRLRIVATTGPVGDLVRNVAGEHARVDTLMGPGVDPHLYRELPSDMVKLDRADVIFFNGLHLEGRMGDTLARLGRTKPVFAVTDGLKDSDDPRLLTPPGYSGYADPHVWHDVALWADCLQRVVDAMCEVDPQHADDYRAAGAEYGERLAELDEECRRKLAQIPEERRVLVTAHDAFAYFSRAYGLETVGLKGISTEDEVDLKHMQEVAQLVAQRRVPCVFVETAVAPRIMQALAEAGRAEGYEVFVPLSEEHQLYADALGPPGSGAENYVGMIRANVNTIVAGLTGQLAESEG